MIPEIALTEVYATFSSFFMTIFYVVIAITVHYRRFCLNFLFEEYDDWAN